MVSQTQTVLSCTSQAERPWKSGLHMLNSVESRLRCGLQSGRHGRTSIRSCYLKPARNLCMWAEVARPASDPIPNKADHLVPDCS